MRIILAKSTQEAVSIVSTMVADKLSTEPKLVVGLATGRTMEPVYADFVSLAKSRNLQLQKTSFFMLDEYVGIDQKHPSSFKSYIQQHLMLPLDLHEEQMAFPPTHLVQLTEAGDQYERLIKEAGGIDIQLLGIGVNGHIGFNEPGSAIDSRTRVVELTAETREANKSHFGAGEMPTKALSMGIGSILEGRQLILLATGKSKADAIKYLLNHHEDNSCPATFLKSHPYFTLVLDPEAASKISLKI